MTKLKTLKDLKRKSQNPMYNIGFLDCMIASKAEAIKWVKFFEDEETNSEGAKMINVGRMKSLIDFCNLTEKDLK